LVPGVSGRRQRLAFECRLDLKDPCRQTADNAISLHEMMRERGGPRRELADESATVEDARGELRVSVGVDAIKSGSADGERGAPDR